MINEIVFLATISLLILAHDIYILDKNTAPLFQRTSENEIK